jgi:penicillin-binding protein 1B
MRVSRRSRILLRWAGVLGGLGACAVTLLVVYGVALVDGALAGDQPRSRRVLAAGLELEPGTIWTLRTLQDALERRGLSEVRGIPRQHEFLVANACIVIGPNTSQRLPVEITARFPAAGLSLSAADGRPVVKMSISSGIIGTTAPQDTIRWPARLGEIAPVLLTATVDIEDREFLAHGGLSFRGLLRAVTRDLLAGGVREGGSTITQQLVKVLLLRPARTLPRKVVEAWLATLLEYRYDKRTILEAYLNRVYLGQDGGLQLVGVEAGSHYLFGKPAAALRLEEAALLAGMIAAPNRFDPFLHSDAARLRRRVVLGAMVRSRHIDAPLATQAAATPLPDKPHHARSGAAVGFVEQCLTQASSAADVQTTMEIDLQQAARDGCREALQALERRHPSLVELGRSGDPLQVAVVVLGLDGSVLALQGGRTAAAGEFDRATTARRQVGSLVKPFVAATAFAEGWEADSRLADEPLRVAVGRQVWEPHNSDGRFRGIVSVRDALVQSLNVPMVRLGLAVSLPKVVACLRRVGLAAPADTPAILLGAVEASPLEVARAFLPFLDGGRIPPVHYTPGRTRFEQAVDPRAALAVRDLLVDVPRNGTAAVLAGQYVGWLAAKTGTTDDRRDSWFVALRPRLVTVVWVGTDGNRETGLYGATGALHVWQAIDARMPEAWRMGTPFVPGGSQG